MLILLMQGVAAQDPDRFKDEVEQLSAIKYQFDNDKPVLLLPEVRVSGSGKILIDIFLNTM